MEFVDRGGGTVDPRLLWVFEVLSHRMYEGEAPNVERRCLAEGMWLPYWRVAQKWVRHISRDAESGGLDSPAAEDLMYRYEGDRDGCKMVMRLWDIMDVPLVFESEKRVRDVVGQTDLV